MAKKKVKKKKPGEAAIAMGRKFAKMAQRPLKKKGGDAWNERQNRLASSRDAAKLLIKGTIAKNKAKAKKKKVKKRGTGPSK